MQVVKHSFDKLLAKEVTQLSLEERERMLDDLQVVPPSETDRLLAKKLAQISLAQRDEGLHDLHGVADAVEETPGMTEGALNQLQIELENTCVKNAYDLARSTNAIFVGDTKFRLMFLRADRFRPKDAASRMVKYFEEKLRLFGPEKLTRPIIMEDLNDDDIAALKSGYLMLLLERDRAGRPILFSMLNRRCVKVPENSVSASSSLSVACKELLYR